MMSWNKVFDYFIEIKLELGENFTFRVPFKELVEQYGTREQYDRIKDLQFTQHKSLLLIKYGDYNIIYDGGKVNNEIYWTLHDGFYRECRSLVIDLEREKMVLTPYAKFLNMNETHADSTERVMERISKAKVFEVSNKLDGSMVSGRYVHGDYILSMSQSLDPKTSWRLAQATAFLTEEMKKLLKDYSHCTFIFELLSKEDSHVVQYTDADYGLHLIGIRDTTDGRSYNYCAVQELAKNYCVPHTVVENLTFTEMLESLKVISACEKEGYVLNIDGYRVKCKGDDYCNIHKLLSHVTSPNIIIKAIEEGSFDDLISKVPTSSYDQVMEIYQKVHAYRWKLTEEIEASYSTVLEIPGSDSKKGFMLAIQTHCDVSIRGYVIQKYLGQSYNILKHRSGRYVKMAEIDEYLGD